MEAQERQPIPRINDPAPDFKAMSTHGGLHDRIHRILPSGTRIRETQRTVHRPLGR